MILYLAGLAVSMACGLWFIIKPPQNRYWLHWLLSAGGAYLIAILFTHILPELFEELGTKAGYVLLIGFLIQILLENYSKGIEHGHAHSATSKGALTLAYLALCLHALIEGMPMASALFDAAVTFDAEFTVGVMLHKMPVAIALATLFNRAALNKPLSAVLMVGFIACTVVGSFLQYALGSNSVELMFISMGLTVGILFHVSTTILFESSNQHKLSIKSLLAILIGLLMALAI